MRFLFLFQAGAIQDKVCVVVASITPVQRQLQQSADPLLQVLAAVAEHSVLALSRLLKAAAAKRLPMLLLSTPVLFSLVDVVSAGGKGLMLSQRAIVSSFAGFAMVHRCTWAGHSFSVPPPRVQPRAARITVAT